MISKGDPTWHTLEWQLLTGPNRNEVIAELDRAWKKREASGVFYGPIERYSFGLPRIRKDKND
jgi:hypothetical protein